MLHSIVEVNIVLVLHYCAKDNYLQIHFINSQIRALLAHLKKIDYYLQSDKNNSDDRWSDQ